MHILSIENIVCRAAFGSRILRLHYSTGPWQGPFSFAMKNLVELGCGRELKSRYVDAKHNDMLMTKTPAG